MNKDIDKEIKALENSLAETNKRLEELKKKASEDTKKIKYKLISEHYNDNDGRVFSAIATGYSKEHERVIKKFFIDRTFSCYGNPLDGYSSEIDDLIGLTVEPNDSGGCELEYMGYELTNYGRWLRNKY
jgi:hypothetical protein